MGLFDRFDSTPAMTALALAATEAELAEANEENRYLYSELREVKEDLLKIADAFDNIGWAPLGAKETKELDLPTIKKIAVVSRSLYAMNPFVQSGVNARIGYIWGRGVNFDGVDDIADVIELNRRKLFNADAYTELERVLATDGNSFVALPTEEHKEPEYATAIRIPLEQIMSAVSNPDDYEDVRYYRREWTIWKTNGTTGEIKEEKQIKYYASAEYYKKLKEQGKALPRRWKDAGVEQNYAIQHDAVNRQVGWRWGVPDILPVIFWAKAYKEYLEDNATLVKAYSRLAWQVQSSNPAGAQAAGAQVLAPPTRDPYTGELRNIGGTAITGPGTTATAMPATGSAVDFSKGNALAAAIAAGLQVSKTIITRDPGDGNRATAETLDLPTLKAMEARQAFHSNRFLSIFQFWGAEIAPIVAKDAKKEQGKPKAKEAQEALPATGSASADKKKPSETNSEFPTVEQQSSQVDEDYALVSWPQIESDSTKDRIAALGLATEGGFLFKQEARKDAIDVLGIAPYKPWDILPTMEDDPGAMQKFQQDQMNADKEFERSQQEAAVVAKQGVSGGVSAKGGAQSTANSSRQNRKSDSNNK